MEIGIANLYYCFKKVGFYFFKMRKIIVGIFLSPMPCHLGMNIPSMDHF